MQIFKALIAIAVATSMLSVQAFPVLIVNETGEELKASFMIIEGFFTINEKIIEKKDFIVAANCRQIVDITGCYYVGGSVESANKNQRHINGCHNFNQPKTVTFTLGQIYGGLVVVKTAVTPE